MHILIGNCTGKYLSLQTRWYQCNPLGTDSVYVLDIQLIPQICGGLFFFSATCGRVLLSKSGQTSYLANHLGVSAVVYYESCLQHFARQLQDWIPADIRNSIFLDQVLIGSCTVPNENTYYY